jgi:hypothetical protein
MSLHLIRALESELAAVKLRNVQIKEENEQVRTRNIKLWRKHQSIRKAMDTLAFHLEDD